jgi:hypothetical protein
MILVALVACSDKHNRVAWTYDNTGAADTKCSSERTPVAVPPVSMMGHPYFVLEFVYAKHKAQEDGGEDQEGHQLDD